MIFKPRQKKCNIQLKILLNNYKIYIVKLISFLRIILDENLTWKSHISLHTLHGKYLNRLVS